MTQSAVKQMTNARAKLLMEHVFFGSLALRLILIEDTTIDTGCTDGSVLRYNPAFVDKLNMSETKGFIAHEVAHCALNHMSRRGSRDPENWNKACDYAINPLLVDSGLTLPTGGLLNPAYTGSAEHIYSLLPPSDKSDKPDNSGPSNLDPGGCGGVSDAAPGSVFELEAEWKMALAQATHVAKQQGQLPASLLRTIDEIMTPVIPWRNVLRRFMTERSPDDFSWARGNRRFIAQGLYLPSRNDTEHLGVVVVTIDTSGSIGFKELSEFGAEIKAIVSETRPSKVYVIYCDARVAHVDEFGPDDELVFEAHGGGGTDFRPPFEWLAKQQITPKAFIYLTDGYGSFPEHAPEFPVLWCINNKQVIPPHGEHVVLGV